MNCSSLIRKSPAIAFLSLVIGVALWVRCSNPQTVDGGTQTETVNCSLDGTLYGPDGKPMSSGTKVRVHPRQTPDDTTTPAYTHFDTATVFTNDSGKFSFDSLDAGIYVIESDNGVLYGRIDSIVYSNPDSTVRVVDTLWAPGTISGTVKFAQGGDPRAVFVVVWGLERLGQVQADGGFSLSTMAAGTYTVRFIPLISNYSIQDIPGVVVKPGETTVLDTVVLSYTGIPIPTKPALAYDTSKQLVALSWNKADSSRVRGYNVYRMMEGGTAENVLLNGNVPVKDTSYVDSTVTPGNTYKYRVTCIDTAGMEGAKSEAVQVTLFSAFTVVDSLVMGNGTAQGQFGNRARVAVGPGGSLYITDTKSNRLQKLSPKGEPGFSLSLQSPEDLSLCNDGKLYVCDRIPKKVLKVDTSGNVIKTWSTKSEPYYVATLGDTIIVATWTGIEMFDSSGLLLDTISFPAPPNGFFDISINQKNEPVLIFDNQVYKVNIVSKTLDFQYSHPTNLQGARLVFLGSASVGISGYDPEAKMSRIDILSEKGVLRMSYQINAVLQDVQYVNSQTIICVTGNGMVLHLESNLNGL